MKKLILVAIVAFLVGLGLAWLITRESAPSMSTPEDTSVEKESADLSEGNRVLSNNIAISDQKAGGVVVVARVIFKNPGWVAIHEDRDGKPGNILGAAWFPEGEQGGSVELLRTTEAEKVYYAMLHRDDGDHVFDYAKDAPLFGEDNKPVMTIFKAN